MDRRLVLIAALSAASCDATVRIDPASLDQRLFILARTDADGVPTTPLLNDRVLTREQLFAGLRVPIDHAGSEMLLVVGFDEAAIRAEQSRFTGAIEDIRLVLDPGEPALKLREGLAELRPPPPGSAGYYRFDADGGALVAADAAKLEAFRARTKLVVPIEVECRYPGVSNLLPFGAEERMPAECRVDLSFVARLDAERVIAIGAATTSAPAIAFVARRGVNLDCSKTTNLPARVRAIAVHRPTGTLYVAYATSVVSARIDGDRIMGVSTATTVNPHRHPIGDPARFSLGDIAVADDGTVVAVGTAGFALTRTGGATEWVPTIVETGEYEVPRASLRSVAPTGLAAHPFVLGAHNRYFAGDPRVPASLLSGQVTVRFDNDFAIADVFAAHTSPPTYWFVGTNNNSTGLLAATHGMDAAEAAPRFPGRADSCLDAQFEHRSDADRVAADAGAAYLLPTCNALVRLRTRDHCVSLHPVPGADVGPVRARLRQLDALDGVVTVVGNDGAIYELDFSGVER